MLIVKQRTAADRLCAMVICLSERFRPASVAQARIFELFSQPIFQSDKVHLNRPLLGYGGLPHYFRHTLAVETKWLPDIQPRKKHTGVVLGNSEKFELIREFCPSIHHTYSREETIG